MPLSTSRSAPFVAFRSTLASGSNPFSPGSINDQAGAFGQVAFDQETGDHVVLGQVDANRQHAVSGFERFQVGFEGRAQFFRQGGS